MLIGPAGLGRVFRELLVLLPDVTKQQVGGCAGLGVSVSCGVVLCVLITVFVFSSTVV